MQEGSLLRHLKFFFNFILFLTITPSIVIPTPVRAQETFDASSYFHQRVPILKFGFSFGKVELCTFDDFIDFIEFLEHFNENESITDLTDQDQRQIQEFFRFILPKEYHEEIDHLFDDDEAFNYHDGWKVILCKSWISKRLDQVTDFCKDHKKSIIITTAVAVAVVVVMGVVIAGAAGAAAGAASSTSKLHKSHHDEKKHDIALFPVQALQEAPIFKETIQEEISCALDEVSSESGPISRSEPYKKEPSFREKARDIGALIAHQAFDGVSELVAVVPQLNDEIRQVGDKFLSQSLVGSGKSPVSSKEKYEDMIASGHQKIDEIFSSDQTPLYSQEVKEGKNNIVIGVLPLPVTFNELTNRLLEAGKVLDRGALTKAGRALVKHGYREESVFPKPTGNPAQINEHGQKILETILNHPEKEIIPGEFKRYGKVVDIKAPGIGGVRYTDNGDFIGFLEP